MPNAATRATIAEARSGKKLKIFKSAAAVTRAADVEKIQATNRFLRDLKLARKRGKPLGRIEAVIGALAQEKKLAPRNIDRIAFRVT